MVNQPESPANSASSRLLLVACTRGPSWLQLPECIVWIVTSVLPTGGHRSLRNRSTIGASTLVGALLLASCGGGSSSNATSPPPPPPAASGGSDYGWYQLDPPCNREPYGVVSNYNTASTTINDQLQQMYNNGQRRLRIPIFHGRGLNSGTVMDSTGGDLAPQFRTNLTNLLAAIKAAGFVEIEVSFHPQGGNDPTQWTTYSEDYFEENWNLISNLHPIIAGAGIPYHIDLSNEGIPASSQPALLEYDQKLWNDYVSAFGSNDTLGFSIIPDPDRLNRVSLVYGPSAYGSHGSPPWFDIHFYDNAATDFATASSALAAQGYQTTGWIIGEAFYNDAEEAAALRQEIQATGQTVLYLTQWPVTADRSCSPDVNVAPPLDFSNYQANGF